MVIEIFQEEYISVGVCFKGGLSNKMVVVMVMHTSTG